MQMRSHTSTRMLPLGRLEPRSVGLRQLQETVMHGHKTRLHSVARSSIVDCFALNSNDLTWIALVTVGVIAVGMSM